LLPVGGGAKLGGAKLFEMFERMATTSANRSNSIYLSEVEPIEE
jgi:hypothetical protein